MFFCKLWTACRTSFAYIVGVQEARNSPVVADDSSLFAHLFIGDLRVLSYDTENMSFIAI